MIPAVETTETNSRRFGFLLHFECWLVGGLAWMMLLIFVFAAFWSDERLYEVEALILSLDTMEYQRKPCQIPQRI